MADSKPGVHVLQLKPVVVSQSMVVGEKFIKWDEDSSLVTAVTLRVDPQGYFLCWTDQNEETQILDMCTIRDTRTGRYAKVPKDQKMKDQVTMGASQDSLDDKTVTIAYGPDFVNVSFFNFCTSKKETAKLWTDEILKMANNLLALNGSVHSFLRKAYVRLTLQADKTGRIAVKNIVRTYAQHKDDRRRVEKAFYDSTGLASGKDDTIALTQFSFDDYYRFYRKLTGRQEMEKIFEEVSGNKPYITVEQFVEFLNSHQRDPRLNEILYPYANPDRARDLFQQYEPADSNTPKGTMTVEGFLRFLISEDNSIVSPEKFDLSHDMQQPMCHYFINSSHNTYLTGHQFTGKSSVEIYRQTLLGGCRCVELDFWNGKNEDPIIYHGYTLVPEVPAKEVIEAIAESAFKTSDYPVILSFENHCNPKQQAKIAQYCREYFGDMMLDTCLENHPLEPGTPLPPPALLKRKIIIKNKKKHVHHHRTQEKVAVAAPAAIVAPPPPVPISQGNGDIPRPRLDKEESKDSITEDEDAIIHAAVDELEVGSESEDEDESSTLSDLTPEEIRLREKAQKDKGTAGKETEAGAEISALVNYVQPVHFHSFEHAERRNRSYEMSSFVETQSTALLKEHPIEFVNYNKRQMSRIYPRGTRVDSSNYMPHVFWNAGCQLVALNFQTLDLAMQLNIGIFEMNGRSGFLLKPTFMRRMDRKFDPFAESTVDGIIAGTVSVQVISGQFLSDKRVSTYVEVDMFGLPADTVRKRFRTKTVLNNGINPIYDQDPFVFNKVVLPDLACLRIAVYEDSGRFLGHRVLPVTGLYPGYRHLGLRNECGQPLNLATLFVNIMVKDYVPDGLSDFANALANPIKYQSELEKRAKQLSILTGESEDPFDDNPDGKTAEEKEEERDSMQPGKPRAYPQASLEGDTSASPSVDSSTTAKRQDSTKQKLTATQSIPRAAEGATSIAAPMKEPEVELEPLVVAETFDKLMESKLVKKQRDKLNKKLEDLQKDYDKEKCKLEEELGIATKSKARTGSRLIKRISSKNINKESVGSKSSGESVEGIHAQRLLPITQKFNEDKANLRRHYHELIYGTLEKCIVASKDKQFKLLKGQRDSQLGGATKSIHDQVSREFKTLNKRHKDKDELDRMKREKREEIVRKGVIEHERLEQQYDRKEKELNRQYEELQKRFEEEKTKDFLNIGRDCERSISTVSDEVFDSVLQVGTACKS